MQHFWRHFALELVKLLNEIKRNTGHELSVSCTWHFANLFVFIPFHRNAISISLFISFCMYVTQSRAPPPLTPVQHNFIQQFKCLQIYKWLTIITQIKQQHLPVKLNSIRFAAFVLCRCACVTLKTCFVYRMQTTMSLKTAFGLQKQQENLCWMKIQWIYWLQTTI